MHPPHNCDMTIWNHIYIKWSMAHWVPGNQSIHSDQACCWKCIMHIHWFKGMLFYMSRSRFNAKVCSPVGKGKGTEIKRWFWTQTEHWKQQANSAIMMNITELLYTDMIRIQAHDSVEYMHTVFISFDWLFFWSEDTCFIRETLVWMQSCSVKIVDLHWLDFLFWLFFYDGINQTERRKWLEPSTQMKVNTTF